MFGRRGSLAERERLDRMQQHLREAMRGWGFGTSSLCIRAGAVLQVQKSLSRWQSCEREASGIYAHPHGGVKAMPLPPR